MFYRNILGSALPVLVAALLIGSLGWSGPVFAQSASSQAAITAEPQGLSELRTAAKRGDANAQHNLGLRYVKGQGVARNYKKSAYWFSKAAEQGESRSQYDLGLQYKYGQGVPKDYKKAADLFRKAAKQGEVHAQGFLGAAYFSGQGVSQNYKKAAHWAGEAANRGDAQAQLLLAIMYLQGDGMKRDFTQAAKWFMIAQSSDVKQYSQTASKALAKLKHALDRQQIAKAKQLAATWKVSHHEE
ncbi:MAG: tetratricopeptide repeat protein [Gammaproteobacteria bacterium]